VPNTATRLITLLMLLQRQPNQQAGQLAGELGVSIRSLHELVRKRANHITGLHQATNG
jgi:predicted DNA-binding transcriptional regulator YafY